MLVLRRLQGTSSGRKRNHARTGPPVVSMPRAPSTFFLINVRDCSRESFSSRLLALHALYETKFKCSHLLRTGALAAEHPGLEGSRYSPGAERASERPRDLEIDHGLHAVDTMHEIYRIFARMAGFSRVTTVPWPHGSNQATEAGSRFGHKLLRYVAWGISDLQGANNYRI